MTRKTDFEPAQGGRASHSAQQGPDELFALRALCRVAESGSFSAAARVLGVQVSTTTRAVRRLEERLGASLFLRSTHGLSLTEAGRAYAAHAARWVAEEDALRDRIAALRGDARGTLRITVPVFVAEHVLPAVVQRFRAQYPDAVLDVHASDDFRDVVKEAFDLAIRLGPLADSTWHARRVASFGRITCASRAFLEARGPLRHPRSLEGLPCLLYGSGVKPVIWSFRKASGERHRVGVQGPLRSNNLGLLVALAAAGLGVVRLPDWAARPAISDGRLVEVLPRWSHEVERDRMSMYALYADDPGKARLRRAFLAALDEVVRG